MERPALQRLLRDVERGVIDVIVVYKVDRLSRSLTHFAKIVEIFEKNKASFVSITQQFNTTSSMGRLTLNILLSFAQFEREVIGERSASASATSLRRRAERHVDGWHATARLRRRRPEAGGERDGGRARSVDLQAVPAHRLGDEAGAGTLPRRSHHEILDHAGWQARPGKPIDKCAIYKILNNRVYLGEAVHKGKSYPGEHGAIIDPATWDKVHAILAENTVARANGTRAQTPALLSGLIFAPGGHAMTPSHSRKNGRLYRYYVSTDAIRQGYSECAVRSVPAAEVEEAVVSQVRHLLQTPEIIARTWAAASSELEMSEREIVATITAFEPLWDELFPADQARIVRLLVERVDVAPDQIVMRLRAEGLQTLVRTTDAKAHAA